MSKQISMEARPGTSPDAEKWVEQRAAAPEPPPEKIKRLTVNLDAELHTRMKIECVKRDVQIAEFIRGLIEGELDSAELGFNQI